MGMTTLEAANILALSPGQVAYLCKTGKLKARKFGPMWEITPDSLDEFKRDHRPVARKAARVQPAAEDRRPGDGRIAKVFGEIGVLNSLNALEQKLGSNNPLQVIEAARLIKQLLIGQRRGVEQLGTNIAAEIEFKVGRIFSPNAYSPPFKGTHRLIQDSFDPDVGAGRGETTSLPLEEFLGCKLLMARGRYYTLKEIILFEAGVLGEIKPVTLQKQLEAYHRISELLSPGGITPALRQLKAIGRVILAALEPYRESIEVDWPGLTPAQAAER
ncbi:MAG: helix-turn-helix domain-containing protein [Anaerolineae bacterium]|nr:helix-turn-helix domain-containing protein [Anaerolineae bacterium]